MSPVRPATLEITSGIDVAPERTAVSNDPVPAADTVGATSTIELSRLVTRTVTPGWFAALSVAPMLRCNPEPMLDAARLNTGNTATFARMLSVAKPTGPATTTRVAQGSGAEPPYVTLSTTLTSPAAMVDVGVIAAQAAFADVNVIGTPPAGAPTGDPPLSSRTVIGEPKPPLSATLVATMLSAAVTLTTVRSSA